MIPLPPLSPIADTAETVAIVEGVNDNTVQTTDQNNNLTRHPSLFTGVDGQFELRITTPKTDVHGLRLRARGQFYEPLDKTPADPDGTLQGVWSSTVATGTYSEATLSLSSTLTSITSARVGDGTLFYTIDPSTTQTTFGLHQISGSYGIELSDRWRLREAGGLLVTNTLSAPPLALADGLELDRRGLDGVQPFATTGVVHDLGWRDTGDISVTYRYTWSPYSLDFTRTPPRIGPQQKIHQLLPDVGWAHLYTPDWLGITRLGLSIASPPNFDTSSKPVVLPVVSEEVHHTTERWNLLGLASFSYGSVAPRLGSGPVATIQGSLAGYPYTYGKWRKLVTVFTGIAGRSSLRGASDSTTTITAVGVSAQARYPLSSWLGLLAGYDVRYSTIGSGNLSTPYFRQILFFGFSGFWTTDGSVPALELITAPFKPG